MITIDDAFIVRVYKTSGFLWAFGFITFWAFLGILTALGWTFGAALSFGVLRSLHWIIPRSFVPGATGAQGTLAKFSLIKLVVITLVLALAIWIGGKSFTFILAFCAGVVLTQAVIVLKVLGMLIREYFIG